MNLSGKSWEKKPHFAKNHENSSIWPKLVTFSSRLPRFGVWVYFSAKSCKRWLISLKTWKIVDLAKTCNVFEEATMFRRLGELFGKKCLISRKSMKKLSIWPKVDSFSRKLPCFVVWLNFSAKSCKRCLISRKSMKNRRFGQNFTLFRAD